MKDLDSFTEGTGVGSFDFSLRSQASSTEELSNEREPPTSSPIQSIETWLDNVRSSTASPPPVPATDFTLDVPWDVPPCESPIRVPKRQLSVSSAEVEDEDERK